MTAVVLLMGSSMADAVGGIARSYRTAFEQLGYDFIEINLVEKEKALGQLKELLNMDVAFAFGFMAMGTDILLDMEGGGKADIWEVLRIPYISLYGDSPAYFIDRHILRNPNYIALYGFPEHCALRKRFPKINGMIDTYTPTAIDVVGKDEIDFKKKAEGSVILLKNGNDPQKLADIWKAALKPQISQILLDIADELRRRINDKATNQIDDIIQEYFKARSIDITPLEKLRLFLIAQLDDYFRRVKATLLVESLLDLPILLNGRNWDHIDFKGRRLQYVPGGDYVVSRGLIRECLAMIDMSPNTGLAAHDRPCRAFGAHTLCLTNEQEFFTRNLPHTDQYFYRFDKDSIQSCVSGALLNRERTLELGATVSKAFMDKFPPGLFCQQLLAMAPLARFNQLPGLPEGMPNYFSWPPTKL